MNAANARYNPHGSEPRRLPVAADSADMVCAFSVFSHMLSDDTIAYLAEIYRILAVGGRAFITAYMEDDVPDITENPAWLREWKGRLHCVLYSTNYLTQLILQAGFTISQVQRTGDHRQVALVLTQASDDASSP